MTVEGVVFPAAFTARSRAYAQALANAELRPELTLLYGDPTTDRPGQGGQDVVGGTGGGEVFLPDPRTPLLETLTTHGFDHEVVVAASVNEEELVGRLEALEPRFVAFSGYGGEIVRDAALAAADFLHIHSGWLPSFRGSTTGYYSWLEEQGLGASAILLAPRIDEGPIRTRASAAASRTVPSLLELERSGSVRVRR